MTKILLGNVAPGEVIKYTIDQTSQYLVIIPGLNIKADSINISMKSTAEHIYYIGLGSIGIHARPFTIGKIHVDRFNDEVEVLTYIDNISQMIINAIEVLE